MALYGTKNLEMWPDMMIKKFMNLALLCLLVNSENFESIMAGIFRPDVLKQRREWKKKNSPDKASKVK